jgi:cysteine desulfurase
MLYFDHNATTPVRPEARQAWLAAAEDYIGNPSSRHRLGRRAERALEHAREELARLLGCDTSDLVWTSGATEANNLALHHFACVLDSSAEVWVSAIEHPCVLAATRHYFPGRHQFIPVTDQGLVDVDWISARLRRTRPGLVAVMAANNETGVLQPWCEVLALCRDQDIPFFCDAAQWLGKLPARGLGACDLVSGCAHKFGGPKGVGFLKVPAQGRFVPLLLGGAQEGGRRAGTENVPGVEGMLAALRACEADLQTPGPARGAGGVRPASASSRPNPAAVEVRLAWRASFERDLLAALPDAEILALHQARLWNTVAALMPDTGCRHRWVVKLDKAGFAVSTGSACASGREKPSHVLAAMGYPPAASDRVVRFSSGWETTREAWKALGEGLAQVYPLV